MECGDRKSCEVLDVLRRLEARLGPATRVTYEPPRVGDVRDSCLRIDLIQRDYGWRPGLSLEAGLDRLVTGGVASAS